MKAVPGTSVLTPLAPGATLSPDSVLFESRGAVLVLGDDAGVARAVEEVAKNQRVTVFAPGIDEVRLSGRVTAVGTRVAALQGRLGAFRAQVRGPDGLRDIGAASPHRDGLFDLVLDLSRKPLMTMEVAPLGYFAPGEDEAARAEAIRSLQGLVGSFTKPRYFRYQAELCAHSASGLTGCTRCLEVCSAAAILSAGGQIRVDAHLCQGCASCTLACPTGALSFNAPSRDVLRERLVASMTGASPEAVLLVHGQRSTTAVHELERRGGIRALPVDPLPALGEELWLEAFALGARAVGLVDDDGLAPASRSLLRSRVAQARVLLQSLGLQPDMLRFAPLDDLAAWFNEILPSPVQSGHVEAGDAGPAASTVSSSRSDKRPMLLDAVSRLGRNATAGASTELLAGASFGEVCVDRQRCTLCFACANVCPTGALTSHDAGAPRLLFAEDACVQCGLCVAACPEKVVSLHPRFRPQRSARGETRTLNEDQLLACTNCGTPFIGARLLASSLERIKGHPVLARDGRERLMTCPSCRQHAMLQT